MPSAALMLVLEWPTPKVSYSLSSRFGNAGEAIELAHRRHALAAARENFVRIGLVADIPDDAVARRVVQIVQRDGELDHAEPRAEMAAGLADRVQQEGAQLIGELRQLGFVAARAGRPGCRCDRAAA